MLLLEQLPERRDAHGDHDGLLGEGREVGRELEVAPVVGEHHGVAVFFYFFVFFLICLFFGFRLFVSVFLLSCALSFSLPLSFSFFLFLSLSQGTKEGAKV